MGGYLRALREKRSHDLGIRGIQFPTEIGLCHVGGHSDSDRLLVAKSELGYCPIAAQ
jgi:hypothetical protein